MAASWVSEFLRDLNRDTAALASLAVKYQKDIQLEKDAFFLAKTGIDKRTTQMDFYLRNQSNPWSDRHKENVEKVKKVCELYRNLEKTKKRKREENSENAGDNGGGGAKRTVGERTGSKGDGK